MSDLKSFLEIFYFLSGPAIAVFVFLGLRQLKISKDSMRLSSKREAFRLAAEQCTHFMAHIIPLMNEYDIIIEDKGCDLITKSQVEVFNRGFSVKYELSNIDIDKLRPVLSKALEVVNCLESFALFFTTRIAAEEVAYTSVSETYCNEVKRLLPVIAMGAQSKKHFQNLLELYFLWKNRADSEQLVLDKDKIEKHIRELGGKTITPLGLEQ